MAVAVQFSAVFHVSESPAIRDFPPPPPSFTTRVYVRFDMVLIIFIFFHARRIQPNAETRKKQLDAWRTLLLDYCRARKVWVIDVREGDGLPVFNNAAISSKCLNMYCLYEIKTVRWAYTFTSVSGDECVKQTTNVSIIIIYIYIF